MTRRIRNRKTLVVAVLATAALAAGGVALAADGDEAPAKRSASSSRNTRQRRA